MKRLLPVAVMTAVVLACASASHAETPLTGLRHAKFKDSVSSSSGDAAKITFAGDLALYFVGDPTCAGGDEVELVISSSLGSTDHLFIPCTGWKAKNWLYSYKDKNGSVGGIKKMSYGYGKLTIQMKGANYRAIRGPAEFVEISLRVGTTVLCGRTTQFSRNDATAVVALGPMGKCQDPIPSPTEPPTATETATQTPTLTASPTQTVTITATATSTHTASHTVVVPTATPTNIPTQSPTRTIALTATRTPSATATATPVCGDGVRQGNEECDDGNSSNLDCCLSTCRLAALNVPCLSDGNICTDDVCDGAGTCQHNPNTVQCSDDSACTTSDHCSNGACGGTLIKPWINEVNYDGYDLIIPTRDHEEFVEIAGPAGLDLSGFKVSAVEGKGDGSFLNPCLSGSLNAGEAYFTAALPSGTVIQDNTGKGTGFIVVCFEDTSSDVVDDGKCDVVLGGMPSSDSNLKEGALSNLYDCADGVLLRDPSNNLVDAVSYEGHVANSGSLGGYFVGAPDIGRDWGLATDYRRSLVKTTDNLQREVDESKWADSGNNNDSPGAVNGIQNLSCYQAPGYTNTQYPIVLLHGLYGFDSLFGVMDYWYGITGALTDGGATVYVATMSQLNSPQARGQQAIPQIEQLLAQTGKSKVNLIGHSQGALDARYIAAVRPDLVASVTSVAGPHKGAPIADLLHFSFRDGTFGEDVLGLLGNTLGDLLATLSGSTNPNDAILAINSLTSDSMAAFNATYPAGVPTTACGEGAPVVNGIYYFSWTGTGIQTNPLDPGDDYLGYASAVFLLEANDGLVGKCSSHLGDVIKDTYYQNHIDEVNLLFGLVSPFEVNPKTLFRQQANRLKNLGL